MDSRDSCTRLVGPPLHRLVVLQLVDTTVVVNSPAQVLATVVVNRPEQVLVGISARRQRASLAGHPVTDLRIGA